MDCVKYNQIVKIKLSLFGHISGSILNLCKDRKSLFILLQLCALIGFKFLIYLFKNDKNILSKLALSQKNTFKKGIIFIIGN